MFIDKNLANEAYAQAFNHAPIGMALVSPDGQRIHGNSALSQILGYSLEELNTLTIQEMMYPEDLDNNTALMNELLQGKRDSYRLEKRLLHKSGFTVWAVLSASLVHDQKGNAHFFLVQMVDITELKESEQKHKLISENSIDVISKLTLTGEYLFLSPSCASIVGYEPQELIGQSFYKYLHPDDLPEITEKHCNMLSQHDTNITLTYRFLHKNGSYVWLETTGKTLIDKNGCFQELITFSRDIRERKLAEEKLIQSEKTLKQAQRLAHIGNWEYDMLTHEAHWSDEIYPIVGLQPSEVSPSYELLLKHVHPDDLKLVKNAILDGMKGARNYSIEYRIIQPNGTLRHILSHAEAFFDEIGRPVRLFGTIQDITARRIEQNKLREHEALLKLIAEHAQDLISCVNPEGVNEYVSPAVRFLLGYEPVEVVGKKSTDFYHPDDLARILQSDLLQHSDQDTFITRVRHKEGHYAWFESTVKIIRNSSGEIEKVVGVGRDISERKLAEEATERLESFVKNNADAIWMVNLDDIVLEVNGTFETMFGWQADEVIGKPLPIIPETLIDTIRHLHNRVKTGESIKGMETIRQRKDGGTLHVSTTLSPVEDTKGNVIGISGVCRDISEKKLAEEAATTTRRQLQSFIDNHIDAIMIYSKDGKVMRVNPAFEKLFGWTAEELLNRHFTELLYIPDHRKDEAHNIMETVKGGQFVCINDTIRVKKDGESIDILLTAFPIYHSDDEFIGCSIVMRDITGLKKSQEILQNSEKLTVAGQLAAGIAHEIRNPLTAIKGFIQLVKDDYPNTAFYFDIMTAEIERIELIVGELLILSKPHTEKVERKDVRVLLAQVVTLLDSQAIMENVQIKTEYTPGVTYILCDENQMKQVFINFIKNGIESMPDGGELLIQIQSQGSDQMLVRFTDQGCGIPDEILSKIGQPFYTTKSKGTGLGFMISKKIVENHHGFVEIKSQVNVGTTIEIMLPVSK